MFQLIIWLGVLIILLMFCYYISDNKILTPELCYIAGFVPQVLQAFFYIQEWNLNLSYATLLVLIEGGVLFVLASFLSGRFFRCMKTRKSYRHSACLYSLDKKIMLVFTVFEALTVLLTAYFLISSYDTTLSRAIYLYRAQYMVSYHGIDLEVVMPKILRLCRRITTAVGYFWAYLLMQRIVLNQKKGRGLIIINFILSVINSFVATGGRKGIFLLVITALVDLYLIYGMHTGWKMKIKIKSMLKLIAFGFVFIGLFKYAGGVAGKTINLDFGDYLAMYLSAPLKNLDLFIRKGNFGISDISESASFAHLVQYLNARGFLNPYADAFRVNYHNGINLGNAYTTYFSYIHDYGYAGLAGFVIFSAVLCQFIFQKAKKNNAYNISIYTIVYAYLFSNLVFGFFSNFFITSVFDMTLVWNIIVWVIMSKLIKIRLYFGIKEI